eukprot:NODE_2152_length_976_cov_12.407767_g1766_i0.p2 GENE.NODE_2152_length_976_cov_12.407767_g1766_i0~~NODE_2152_length_976_cov_12.407767_g1766_i0.p2  ORF type:complete len:144 (-),score=49.73 NODE_2152_length_976_cov_12.407767_g1766_i0:126-557(-)
MVSSWGKDTARSGGGVPNHQLRLGWSRLCEQEHNESREATVSLLQGFSEPPFTLQRLCELLQEPTKHHSTKEKLLFAIEKLVTISSTLPKTQFPYEDVGEAVGNGMEADEADKEQDREKEPGKAEEKAPEPSNSEPDSMEVST